MLRKTVAFYYNTNLPQIKRDLIRNIANLIYDFPHNLQNNLKMGNISKTSNLDGDRA